ncbi:peptidyl-dipeptidase A [Panacagrimonas perspica]|uniref:Peptidyl-dipeptidase A n=1 Tax=Panacagrimonas perspica TaxID=381431 RepID=A0A4S3K3T5_9GAMM|nr:M2 family metallopeptidase [Panacagrimonas perspica]TDU28766.1 peptidyl-dipeptidase A [Panacagrimonas perspica]THD02394.1 peptidyl-dipeptidase [Panacagrimonas perspica]
MMKSSFAIATGVGLLFLAACNGPKESADAAAAPAPVPAAAAKPGTTAADADALVAEVDKYAVDNAARLGAAFWIAQTYITDDAQLLAANATEEQLEFQSAKAEEAKRFNDTPGLSPETARALTLIKLGPTMPAPSDPAKRKELAAIAAKMDANYGAGQWCRPNAAGQEECLKLQQIEKIVDNVELKNTPAQIEAAWNGWHQTSRPIRKDYQRFTELMNEGASQLGFKDTGELWRGGYDMSPAEFDAEVERLWGQVKPMYDDLHCLVRDKLNKKYGDAVVPKDGLIPAHLLGNMWAQQWSNLYPLLEPYPGQDSLDVSSALKAQRDAEYKTLLAAFKGKPTPSDIAELEHKADAAQAVKMAKVAEDFYVSLGFPKLPESFWAKSLLVQPRDRDVVCHASAWDMNLKGDVRIKQCIEPDEEELTTIHHELGHIYYYLSYNHLRPVFQSGAHDGFHEAIGDTITLSLTPEHLKKIGLVKSVQKNDKATINSQMKLALDKIVFLPWGKLVDQWRWKVFSGQIKPEDYNAGWWKLREQYQGVSPPNARSEDDFDPGAKYHIPGNTPYTRYFLSFVLQFQFQKALCDASGFKGPLSECDVYGNAEAGKRFIEMLALGSSQPWPDTLEKLTGTRKMDASAIIEYFTPLIAYMKEQNQGKSCGWKVPEDAPAAAAAAPAT